MDIKVVIQELGGAHAVGRLLGITGQAVSQWKRVPLDQAIKLESITEGKVTARELRPDVYEFERVATNDAA